jgi:SOS-response transcriptional repressor LexA
MHVTAETSTERPPGPRARGEVLTVRRQKIVAYIARFLDEHGYPPSMREIGAAVGLSSTSSVAYQLQALEKKGALRQDLTARAPTSWRTAGPRRARPSLPTCRWWGASPPARRSWRRRWSRTCSRSRGTSSAMASCSR